MTSTPISDMLAEIKGRVAPNGVGGITGPVLQAVLLDIVNLIDVEIISQLAALSGATASNAIASLVDAALQAYPTSEPAAGGVWWDAGLLALSGGGTGGAGGAGGSGTGAVDPSALAALAAKVDALSGALAAETARAQGAEQAIAGSTTGAAAPVSYIPALPVGAGPRTIGARFDDQSSAGNAPSFAAVATLARRVWVPPGIYSVTASVTVTADLIFDQGAVLSVAAGCTLTIAGHIDAPLRQIFNGPGTVLFAPNSATTTVYPEWWGGAPGGPDVTAALSPCLVAARAGNKRVFLSGWYTMGSGPADAGLGPGHLIIEGCGQRVSGFKVANGVGGLVFRGTKDGLADDMWDVLHIRDFGVMAMGAGGGGVSRGDAILATWPVAGGDIEPTFVAENIWCGSDTYTSEESSKGYFAAMIHTKQANMARVVNFTGIAISNTTTKHIFIDNSNAAVGGTTAACYGYEILKPNMQGGNYGIFQVGELEELLIEPLGMDTQNVCIYADGTGNPNGSGNNGVMTIRGGDLNGELACIEIHAWRWVIVDGVNAGIFSANGTSNKDVVAFYGVNVYSSYVSLTNCFLSADQQDSAHCCARFNGVGQFICSDNLFGNCGSDAIVVQNPGGQVPVGNIEGNIFNSVGAKAGSIAILISTGVAALITGNNICGYETPIIVQGSGCRVFGNLSTACTNPPSVVAGNSLDIAGYSSYNPAANGHITLPSGLILQWGIVGGGNDIHVSFDIPFPNAVLSLTTSIEGNAQLVMAAANVNNVSNAGFDLRPRYVANGGGGAVGVATTPSRWVAIGF